ncbi:MAG TPA: hypothetical protein VLL49_01655 [Anaerolineales bacterium]|nr:hypothetical protein [Anaerolineales bacterium]
MTPTSQLEIPIRRIFWVLVAGALALVALDWIPGLLQRFADVRVPAWVVRRVSLDGEANLPAWFSTMLLGAVSLTALLNHWLQPPARNLIRRGFWLVLGMAFAFLSLDEAAQLHELIDNRSHGQQKWVFYYAPVAAAFLLACVYYLVRLRRDRPALRNWILGGMLAYVSGALLAEYVSWLPSFPGSAADVEVVLEESLEMLGAILIWMGCLHELQHLHNALFARRRPLAAGSGSQA